MKNLFVLSLVLCVGAISATASYGESYWAKIYVRSSADEGYAMQQTSDLGYIVAVKQSDASGDSYRVMKLTDTGEISWDKVISTGNIDRIPLIAF